MPDPTSETLKIGALATATGTTTPTIRFYEEIGLLPAATRQTGGQRRYGIEDVKRLTFIRRCRDFGFPVEQVRELVNLIQDSSRSCTEVRDIAHAHLDAVRRKLAELRALERDIARFVERCDSECVGGPGPSCVPLTELTREGTRQRSSRHRTARVRAHQTPERPRSRA
jgi:DNA-binding transcriptional MerR regulator